MLSLIKCFIRSTIEELSINMKAAFSIASVSGTQERIMVKTHQLIVTCVTLLNIFVTARVRSSWGLDISQFEDKKDTNLNEEGLLGLSFPLSRDLNIQVRRDRSKLRS